MTPCNQLDDYLARDLSSTSEADFVAHLEHCESCRSAVATQQHIARLLSQATNLLETVPTTVLATIHHRHSMVRIRHLTALAAAIALAITAIWWSLRPVQRSRFDDQTVAEIMPTSRANEHNPVRIAFAASSKVTAVPLASDQPNVSVYWVFAGATRPSNSQRG